MPIEFTVELENRPGRLAHLGSVLGEAGINIDAIHGMSREQNSFIQFVPDHPDGAKEALDRAGIKYTQREVLVVNVLDQPGMLGDVALVMADAGINIDSVYVMTSGVVILGVDDLDGAKQVAAGMAVRVNA